MRDFKVIVDNSANVAASIIKNIPERDGEKRLDLLKFRAEKNETFDADSNVYVRSTKVFNITDKPLRLSHLSSIYLDNVAPDFHNREVLIHVCNFAWQGEAQWVTLTPYELGLYPVAKHFFSHIDKTISNIGSWSTHKYYPIILIEDKADKKVWFFEIESSSNWSFELGTFTEDETCYLTVDCCACSENNNGFFKTLEVGEGYESPSVLYGVSDSFENAIVSLLKYKRSHGVKPQELPVCFNDYMNCLWAMPSREKLVPLIDAAANVGTELFCIDDGWFIRDGETADFGDWIENDAIFGEGGFKSIIDYIKSKGMTPGIWLELETAFCYAKICNIAPNAILTRAGLPIGEERQFLNFSCKEVTDYLYARVKHLYDIGIRYIKNDYNHSTGIGCDGDEASFALALMENNKKFFEFIDRLISDMPDLTIENCGSGAMRCDNATLKHFHLQSTSDQEIFTNNPSILRGVQCCMPPEKMGIWSYPFPAVYKYRLDIPSAYTEDYMKEMADGAQTIFNMACSFFGIMTLSGHIEKCDEYNLSLIKKAIEVYKSSRGFILESLPVFIGKQQKIYTKGYSVLALRTANKLRFGIFRNGGEDTIEFEIPKDFANSTITEIYPCVDNSKTISLKDNVVTFNCSKKLTAAVFEIEL
ncbi:MAG: alpha-galactosidase [Clostridia bacterium]|nr:alpha-galactosidase [Clostridia bacterium]